MNMMVAMNIIVMGVKMNILVILVATSQDASPRHPNVYLRFAAAFDAWKKWIKHIMAGPLGKTLLSLLNF